MIFQCTTTERGKYSSRDITPDMLCAGGDVSSDWLYLDNNKCWTTAQVKEARTRARGTVAAPSSPWRRRILRGTLSSEWSAGASAVLRSDETNYIISRSR